MAPYDTVTEAEHRILAILEQASFIIDEAARATFSSLGDCLHWHIHLLCCFQYIYKRFKDNSRCSLLGQDHLLNVLNYCYEEVNRIVNGGYLIYHTWTLFFLIYLIFYFHH